MSASSSLLSLRRALSCCVFFCLILSVYFSLFWMTLLETTLCSSLSSLASFSNSWSWEARRSFTLLSLVLNCNLEVNSGNCSSSSFAFSRFSSQSSWRRCLCILLFSMISLQTSVLDFGRSSRGCSGSSSKPVKLSLSCMSWKCSSSSSEAKLMSLNSLRSLMFCPLWVRPWAGWSSRRANLEVRLETFSILLVRLASISRCLVSPTFSIFRRLACASLLANWLNAEDIDPPSSRFSSFGFEIFLPIVDHLLYANLQTPINRRPLINNPSSFTRPQPSRSLASEREGTYIMGRKDRQIREEGRSKFREFLFMNQRLHEMLRFLGEQKIDSPALKLDEFERLRQEFVASAGAYEQANNRIKFEADQVERAKLLFELMASKESMENDLKQMTTLVLKLSEKVKRERSGERGREVERSPLRDELGAEEEKMGPLEKELEYKKLVVYTFEKNFFKLVGSERKEVAKIKKEVNNNKFASLEELKRQKMPVDRLLEEDEVSTFEEREVLQALKEIDNMIEQRMDNLLDGIRIIHSNAVTISGSLDAFHTKVLINLDKIEHNNAELKKNQKRIDEAAKVVTKPSCIINLIIIVLLALMAYLIVKLIWFS